MSDRITGVVLLLFALWYGFGASRLKAGFGSGPIGPKDFPIILAIFLGIIGLAILITGSSFKPRWPKGASWLDVGLVIASFVAYAYLIIPIGFIAATTIETGLVSQRFGAKWWQALLTGLIISLTLYALFVWVLGVSLPTGRLFRG